VPARYERRCHPKRIAPQPQLGTKSASTRRIPRLCIVPLRCFGSADLHWSVVGWTALTRRQKSAAVAAAVAVAVAATPLWRGCSAADSAIDLSPFVPATDSGQFNSRLFFFCDAERSNLAPSCRALWPAFANLLREQQEGSRRSKCIQR
jgi:hypothetical protein